MNRWKYAVLGSFALTGALSAHDDWSLNNHWNVTLDFVYMRRTEVHDQRIVEKNTPSFATATTLIEVDDLVRRFDFQPGYSVAMMVTPSKRRSFEAAYLYLPKWQDRRVKHGQSDLSFTFKDMSYTHDFVFADRAEAKYTTRIDTAEANYWYHVTPRRVDYFSVSGILGLRYADLRELFEVQFTRGTNRSDYNIHTKNHLYGGQIGGNLQINPQRFWSWDVTAKIGAFANRATQKTFLGDFNNTLTLRDHEKAEWRLSYIAAAVATLTCQFWRHLNAHIGYQMLYLTDVALAPDQIDKKTKKNSGKRLDAYGQALIYGILAGLGFGF
jgi:hypothetical protein